MRRACQITLSDADRTTLERWSRGRSTRGPTGHKVPGRSWAAAVGKENKDIAAGVEDLLAVPLFAGATGSPRRVSSGLEKDAPRGRRRRHAKISSGGSST